MQLSERNARPKDLIKGATADWEVVVGMEVHAQILSRSKLFSGASADYGGAPNDHVSLVDAAMPGMLPVLNQHCLEQAVRTGLGLRATINRRSVFDRKNYFYPDLPQGYQISQYKQPVVGEGVVTVDLPDGASIEVRIERLHIEQDAGKSLHDQHPSLSFVDLNRSGVGLMEIVSRPDMRSAEEAKAYVTKLRTIMRYLGTCDGNMEQGSLRADINVSVRRPGEPLGTRCEIKNVNSIRFIGQAVDYEARRQIGILEDGGAIDQETRLFDARKGETRPMRSKEEAHDYRYFPDPDLLPLELEEAWIEAIRSSLPELPDAKKARFMSDFGLSSYDAGTLVAEKEWADYFETVRVAEKVVDPKLAANWVLNEVRGSYNREGMDLEKLSQSATASNAIIHMIETQVISGKIAKDVWQNYLSSNEDPRKIVESKGLQQVTDMSAIEQAVDAIIAANAGKAAEAKLKPNLAGWFVGQVIKATGGKANPQAVNVLVRRKLGVDTT